MTAKQSKQVKLFTYVNTDNGYVKQQITLFELVTRLSDKLVDVGANRINKKHSHE